MVISNNLYTDNDDDFEKFLALPENRDRLFELINGDIVEKMLAEQRGILVLAVGSAIRQYLDTKILVGRLGISILHRVDSYNYRLPDVSFTADTTTPVVRQGAVLRLPDLAVEVKSPDDSYRQMRDKAAYYLANGVKLVWLVYPEKRLVEVYRADGDIQILREEDMLNGDDVLPGFSLKVSDIFKA